MPTNIAEFCAGMVRHILPTIAEAASSTVELPNWEFRLYFAAGSTIIYSLPMKNRRVCLLSVHLQALSRG